MKILFVSGFGPIVRDVGESRSMLGRAALADDGSVRVRLPSRTGVVLELQDGSGTSLVRMGEAAIADSSE